jgi:hypothetical protein
MNPRSVGDFLKSKFGLFLVFIVVLFAGLWIYSGRQTTSRDAAKHAPPPKKGVELGQVQIPLDQGLESGVPQQVKVQAARPTEGEGESAALVPFRPTPPPRAKRAPAPTPAPVAAVGTSEPARKIRYTSMLASYQAPTRVEDNVAPQVPEVFMPFGTLLKCKLVNTVDSANIDTPIIALLLEDVWQNGKRVLPANTLIHGTAKAGRLRDRVNAQGVWRLVWHDGRELSFNGTALDREYHQEVDGYGITDGSAGIRGRVLATDDLQELKMLASAALSGFARGTQDRTQNALGTTITGSVSNGVREGVGEVFELYAQRTLKEIEDQGYFVRIPAGKEFYVYVLETVDSQKASIGGR